MIKLSTKLNYSITLLAIKYMSILLFNIIVFTVFVVIRKLSILFHRTYIKYT